MSSANQIDRIAASTLELMKYPRSVKWSGLSRILRVWKGVFDPSFGMTSKYLSETLIKHKNRFKCDYAFDMGCGCGVLSFVMMEHDIARVVHAFDHNQNAYRNTKYNVSYRFNGRRRIAPIFGNLFQESGILSNLDEQFYTFGVFNHTYLPSSDAQKHWHPTDTEGGADLISEFLNQAQKKMRPNSCILMPYSDIIPPKHSPITIAKSLGLETETIDKFSDSIGNHYMVLIII